MKWSAIAIALANSQTASFAPRKELIIRPISRFAINEISIFNYLQQLKAIHNH